MISLGPNSSSRMRTFSVYFSVLFRGQRLWLSLTASPAVLGKAVGEERGSCSSTEQTPKEDSFSCGPLECVRFSVYSLLRKEEDEEEEEEEGWLLFMYGTYTPKEDSCSCGHLECVRFSVYF